MGDVTTETDPLLGTRRGLRRALIGLLAVDVALAWVAIQSGLNFVQLIWQALAGYVLPTITLEAYGRQFVTLRLLQGAGWLVTTIVFLRWLRGARDNLHALGIREPGPAPEEALAGCPSAAVGPARLARGPSALWSASDPARPPRSRTGLAPGWVAWAWIPLAVALTAELASAILGARSGGWLAPGGALQLLLLAQLAEIATAVLGIVIVHGVGDRQERLAQAREPQRI